MRALVQNIATGATLRDGAGAALPTAAGFRSAALVEPCLDTVWRAVVARVTHEVVLDLGAARQADCCAVFDVAADYDMQAAVSVSTGTSSTGPWTLAAQLTPGGRRDWGGSFQARSARYWRIGIQPKLFAATALEVAHIALGMATTLRRGEATREAAETPRVTIVGSQATKFGEPVVSFSLRWATLTGGDHAELLALWRATGGPLRPIVLWPDASKPGALYLGRLGSDLRWSESVPVYSGHELTFTEMERVLRG